MGLLKQLRSSLESPSTPLSYPAEWLTDMFGGGRTDSGIRVSELTALQSSTIYTCVDLISGGLASLDLNVYEQLRPRGKRLAWEQDVYWLLHDEPNPEMTAFTFIKTLQCHALLWTNLFAEIERDNAERPIALWPRTPSATRPVRLLQDTVVSGERVVAGTMVYETGDGVQKGQTASGKRLILASDMIHVPGLSLDGRVGKPVIELARQVIGLSLAAERFGGKFFANGLRPSGVIEVPNAMSAQAMENFKRSIREAYTGENMLSPMVIEADMKWHQSDVKPNEAQFLETRKHQREEMGALFHVPTRMLGEAGKSNKATAEQEAIEFVQYTLRPWIRAWQPELKRKLFNRVGRSANKFFPAFYYQDLLTPDADSRGKLIGLLKQWGIGNTDDIREQFLDWNPIGGKAGQDFWMPVNMMDASAPITVPVKPDNKIAGAEDNVTGPETPPAKAAGQDEAARKAFSGIFKDAFMRVTSRTKADLRDFQRAFMPSLAAIATLSTGVEEALGMQEFLTGYIADMHKRSATWKRDEATALAECLTAIRTVNSAALALGDH